MLELKKWGGWRARDFALVAILVVAAAPAAPAQLLEGEIRATVRDPDGLPVPATVEIAGLDPEFEAVAEAGADGTARLTRLPAGVYTLRVRRQGFEDYAGTVEIRSAIPQQIDVVLGLATIGTEITVTDAPPLVDRSRPAPVMQLGRDQLAELPGTTMGRTTVDAVTTLPGWLLEANAVLHPRGSEYDTQYVIDGMPVYDNRSLGFAPAFDNSEFEAVNVLTAGIPAEYGRRMGGVITLDTRRVSRPGRSTELDLQAGTFENRTASVRQQFQTDRTAITIGALGGSTNRYLDPPSLENYTNKATSGGGNLRLDHDLTDRDRLSFTLRSNRTRFLVPNDLDQESAGQRQDRFSRETETQAHYQRTISGNKLLAVRYMFRDLGAELWSNTLSTPVWVAQDRGFREHAIVGSFTVEHGWQTLKMGGDVRINDIREAFQFTDPAGLPALDVDFADSDRSKEAGLFVQDQLRAGNLSASVGVRFDHYDLLVTDNAFSPRVGLSYYLKGPDLVLRASYDRIFQPPPIENLLLSSAAAGFGLRQVDDALPVPSSRGHFFEVGLSRPFFGSVRLDVTHYWRRFRNSIDDDVFLNTGLSLPITFDKAEVSGTEVRVEIPGWRWFSWSASYSNMIGRATSPVTGGLFLEDSEADELRNVVQEFPISQDQRNTVAALLRFEPHERVWLGTGIRYGSGLPVEIEEDADYAGISPEVLDKVDFGRGRVSPNFSLDLSAGVRAWESDSGSLTVQLDVRNSTNRLNVINFTGVFSGTALAPGRQYTVQARTRF